METSTFTITGMTCESCVKTVTDRISKISGVTSTDVSLKNKTAQITADRKIQLTEVSSALASTPKYQATEDTVVKESFFKTYKPLLIVFAFVFLVSIAYQISVGIFNHHSFMNHLMAGFFIGLSFFKFLDLKAFSLSFSSYDPLAQRWLSYGLIYPFIELFLGLLFISGKFLFFANTATILILSLTTYGVYLRFQSKSPFQCACLGTTFNLPLSNVTITENMVMILMAIYSLSQLSI